MGLEPMTSGVTGRHSKPAELTHQVWRDKTNPLADYKLSLPLLLEPQEVCFKSCPWPWLIPLYGSMISVVTVPLWQTFVIQGSLALPYQTGYWHWINVWFGLSVDPHHLLFSFLSEPGPGRPGFIHTSIAAGKEDTDGFMVFPPRLP